jgi:hypothetical protein
MALSLMWTDPTGATQSAWMPAAMPVEDLLEQWQSASTQLQSSSAQRALLDFMYYEELVYNARTGNSKAAFYKNPDSTIAQYWISVIEQSGGTLQPDAKALAQIARTQWLLLKAAGPQPVYNKRWELLPSDLHNAYKQPSPWSLRPPWLNDDVAFHAPFWQNTPPITTLEEQFILYHQKAVLVEQLLLQLFQDEAQLPAAVVQFEILPLLRDFVDQNLGLSHEQCVFSQST